MGIRGVRGQKRETVVYTEKSILDILNKQFLPNNKYILNNLFVYMHESDYLGVTKSLIAYEIEVKISRNDFKNDFKHKKEKHLLLENNDRITSFNAPNYFYYATPPDLISVDEIPIYVGLIYMHDTFPFYKIIKEAPKLHSEKFDATKLGLLDKFYYNMWAWKRRAEDEYPNIILDLKEQLKNKNN